MRSISYFHSAVVVLPVSIVGLPCSLFACRLSLKYHPDKNKAKGAHEKFAEINNGTSTCFDIYCCIFLNCGSGIH